MAALDAHLLAARIALALGETAAARRALEHVRVGPREPVDLRVRAKHASALLALADGKRPRAYAALRAGVRLLDDYRVALGATELRAHVGEQAEELAALGLRLALEDADPARVLAWLEECRAGSLGPPARPAAGQRGARGRARGAAAHRRRRPGGSVRRAGRPRPPQAPGDAGGFGPAAHAPRAGRDPRGGRSTSSRRAGRSARRARADLVPGGRAARLHAVTVSDGQTRLHALGGRGGSARGARRAPLRAAPAGAAHHGSGVAGRRVRGRKPCGRPAGRAARPAPGRGDRRAAAGPRPHRRAARDALVDRAEPDRAPARRRAFRGSLGRSRGACRPGPAQPGDDCGRAGTAVRRRRGARGRRPARGGAAPRRGGDGAGGADRSGRSRRGSSRGARIVPCRQPALLVDPPRRRAADGVRPRVARRGARALRPLGVRLRPLGGEGGRRADGAHRNAARPRQRHDRRERRHRSRRGGHRC